MKSGMLAAEAIFDTLSKATEEKPIKSEKEDSSESTNMWIFLLALEPTDYENRVKNSWIWKELYSVRNFRPSFHTSLGVFGGIMYSALHFIFRGKEPFTLPHGSKIFLRILSIIYMQFSPDRTRSCSIERSKRLSTN